MDYVWRLSVDMDTFPTTYLNQGVALIYDLQNLIRWWVGG